MSINYRALDRERKEIRLVRILGRGQDARFKQMPSCHIFHTSLSERVRKSSRDKQQFVALSYVWGNVDEQRIILIDNCSIYVGTNLFNAIMALRRSDESVVIWIDALCINQKDYSEKSWQVGLMTDIYQQASEVWAWIGLADENSDQVMLFLDSFGSRAEACGIESDDGHHLDVWSDLASQELTGNMANRGPSGFWAIARDGKRKFVSRQALVDLFDSISGWGGDQSLFPVTGMQNLFQRPWWGRVWVLQEISLPERAYIVCGNHKISRHRCRAALSAYIAFWTVIGRNLHDNMLRLKRYHLHMTTTGFQHRPNIMLCGENLYRYDRFPLAALLRLTCVGSNNLDRHGPHHLESTDPRDKVFALLGLASDREELERQGLRPDYTMKCEDVYTTTMAILLEQGHISMLSLCQSPKLQLNLPSWVVDWSRSATHMLQDVKNDHIEVYPAFSTTRGTEGESKVVVGRQAGLVYNIKVFCSLHDKIKVAGSFSGRSSIYKVPLTETSSWPRRWLVEILRLTYLHDGETEFRERLASATRTSIGDVGFAQDGRLARLGDRRLPDAIALLQKSQDLIKHRRFKLDAKNYLNSLKAKETKTHTQVLDNKLSSEIIGKSLGRLPFITTKGHLVLSSVHVERDDVVALIKGSQVPFIIRPQENGKYSVVSEAYVDGIMNGEAMQTADFELLELV